MTRSLSALVIMLSLALAASVLSPSATSLESSGLSAGDALCQAPIRPDLFLTDGGRVCLTVVPPWLDRPASRRGSSDLSPSYAAVISPTLTWNTFLGAGTTVQAYAMAIDGSGNVYIAGRSDGAWGAPVNPFAGNTDAFVAKFNSSGHLVWNTFLGSPTGDDWAYGIAVDGNGNARGRLQHGRVGLVASEQLAGGEDAFVARLDTNGNRLWHAFAGGSGNDRGYGIALDGSGNAT